MLLLKAWAQLQLGQGGEEARKRGSEEGKMKEKMKENRRFLLTEMRVSA